MAANHFTIENAHTNEKFWYGLRNIAVGDEEETRVLDVAWEWPWSIRTEALNRYAHPKESLINKYEQAYRMLLQWSIEHEMPAMVQEGRIRIWARAWYHNWLLEGGDEEEDLDDLTTEARDMFAEELVQLYLQLKNGKA